ncbi:MAG: hypothetical protein JKY99_11740, partial [Rhizobiales bacterium]|nr:hypothetical protein [Hyphomicrobiales bacterium]
FAPRLSLENTWEEYAVHLEPFIAYPVAHTRIDRLDEPNEMNADGEESIYPVRIRSLDAMFTHAICRFNLDSGPVLLATHDLPSFWTLNIFSHGGLSYYSTNEQVNAGKPMNVLIASSQQVASMKANDETSLDDLDVVETDETDSAMLFRAYRRHGIALPSDFDELQTVLSCSPFQGN